MSSPYQVLIFSFLLFIISISKKLFFVFFLRWKLFKVECPKKLLCPGETIYAKLELFG